VKRWIGFLGRVGTVLTVVGLALVLVYFIPPLTSGYSTGSWYLEPESFGVQTSQVYNPQSGVRLEIDANGTLDMYAFEISASSVYEWLVTYAPGNWTALSTFQAFKAQHEDLLIMQQQTPVGNSVVEYVPTKVENVTFMFVNPSPTDSVNLSLKLQGIQVIASQGRLLMAMEVTIPLGVILAIPWLLSYTKERRKQQILKT
jgi:hypothetical protein